MAYPDEGVVKGWRVEWLKGKGDSTEDQYIARRAADWELDGCCEWLTRWAGWEPEDVQEFRDHRRRKPGRLKEQALAELDLLKADANTHGLDFNASAIRRALETLPD